MKSKSGAGGVSVKTGMPLSTSSFVLSGAIFQGTDTTAKSILVAFNRSSIVLYVRIAELFLDFFPAGFGASNYTSYFETFWQFLGYS